MAASTSAPAPACFSWLTQNYLIDPARYVAAGVKGQKK